MVDKSVTQSLGCTCGHLAPTVNLQHMNPRSSLRKFTVKHTIIFQVLYIRCI